MFGKMIFCSLILFDYLYELSDVITSLRVRTVPACGRHNLWGVGLGKAPHLPWKRASTTDGGEWFLLDPSFARLLCCVLIHRASLTLCFNQVSVAQKFWNWHSILVMHFHGLIDYIIIGKFYRYWLNYNTFI